MIVEEALLRLENDDLDRWMDIGEAMNKVIDLHLSFAFKMMNFALK